MKRTLKSFASVALVALTVAACQKEQLFDSSLEGEETVTFTVQSDQALTKATADGDGLGEGLNRCFVAVYMKVNEAQPYKLYDTPVATQDGADHKKFTFSVNLIRKQTYQIVVWADKGMYNVNPELTSVTRIADDIACNSDAYDAFYASVPFTQGTTASTAITAKRPFAQLNLITKDLRTGFEPKDIELTYTANTKFNPFDGTTSDPQEITYKAAAPHYTSLTVPGENTVAMNYLLAGDEQVILNEVKLKVTFTEDVDIAVANVPVRRNYRTNIKGNLFTEQTDYTITVNPIWGASDIEVVVPSTYNEAQAAVADPNIQTVVVSQEVVDDYLAKVSSGTITPDTANLPDGSSKKLIEFTLTSTSPVDLKQFELPAAPDGYAWHITHETGYPTQNVDVVAPAASSVIINAPTSHVTLNGENYAAVTASTSGTTLVVPEGIVIDKLKILKGGLEIHGTVNELIIEEGAEVVVRDCEGLSEEVYNVAKDFLADAYAVVQQGETYDIVPAVATVGSTYYANLHDALCASTASTKVTLLKDIDLKNEPWAPVMDFKGEFDGADHIISNLKNDVTTDYVGLIGKTASAKLHNFTICNADVNAREDGGDVGVVAGSANGTISSVHITGTIKVQGHSFVGGIVGNGYAKITDCSVIATEGSESFVHSYTPDGWWGLAGGIRGFCGEGSVVTENVSVKNLTIYGGSAVGGITGHAHYGNTIKNALVANCDIYTTGGNSYCRFVGAISGRTINNAATISFVNCTANPADVRVYTTNSSASYIAAVERNFLIPGGAYSYYSKITNVGALVDGTSYLDIHAAVTAVLSAQDKTIYLYHDFKNETLSVEEATSLKNAGVKMIQAINGTYGAPAVADGAPALIYDVDNGEYSFAEPEYVAKVGTAYFTDAASAKNAFSSTYTPSGKSTTVYLRVPVNFNRKLTEGTEIKVVSEVEGAVWTGGYAEDGASVIETTEGNITSYTVAVTAESAFAYRVVNGEKTYFKTIPAAIKGASEGDVIYINRDLTTSSTNYLCDNPANLVLELNGHTVSYSANTITGSASSSDGAVNFTIIDSIGGGKLESTGKSSAAVYAYSNFEAEPVTITIRSGNYVGANVMYANYTYAKIIIEGGDFTGNLVVKNGGQIIVKGGTFSVDPTSFLAEGYAATQGENGIWSVTAAE